jgi:hypothetical protein
MVVMLAHGDLGSWDELVIVVVGFVVLWVAVKLAGRKPAEPTPADADEDEVGPGERGSTPPVAPPG